MQLLVQYDTQSYDAWITNHDAHAETRADAGLTQMQIWRDADTPSRVVVLFDVHNPAKAKAWVKTEVATGTKITATFLNTA